MSKQISVNVEILQAILNTLDLIEIKGYSNMDKMYGTMRTIQQLLQTKEVIENDSESAK